MNIATATKGETVTVPAGTWTIDPAHSSAEFVARHLMVSKVRGRFGEFSGAIEVADDPTESTARATITAASVTTGDDTRDGHIRSADFFDVENFPTIEFASTGIEQKGSDWLVHGDLTIRGITNPVTLKAEFYGLTTDPWGNERIGFSATTTVDRESWGLTWNQALETGGVLLSKDVKLELEIQAIHK